jgi:phosphatidylinositol glycan class V
VHSFGIDRNVVFSGNSHAPIRCYILTGIAISTICHFLSVLVLYRLVALVIGVRGQQSRIPFVVCVLHTITPASLFLSAPYAESLFALLNITGMFCYAKSKVALSSASSSSHEALYKLCSGALFALATTIRSNGLLSGLILLYDAVMQLSRLLSRPPNVHDICRVIITCISGTLIAVGFVGPQYLAYTEFCGTENLTTRPWCEKSIPSIYSWVQSHYWWVFQRLQRSI